MLLKHIGMIILVNKNKIDYQFCNNYKIFKNHINKINNR